MRSSIIEQSRDKENSEAGLIETTSYHENEFQDKGKMGYLLVPKKILVL